MRYCLSFLLLYLLTSCASELSPEELDAAEANYSYAVPMAAPDTATPDTLIIPEAAANDRVRTPAGTPAPTPYGMTIDEGEGMTAKGAATPTATAPATAAKRLLTGNWVNTEDDREHVAFTPTHYRTYYDGELLVEEDMVFHADCPAACSGGTPVDEPCFTISGPAQTDCYGIVNLTNDKLELQMLGVSNETVVYRRAD